MLIKRRKRARMGVRTSEGIDLPAHRRWVKGCECLIKDKKGHVCRGAMHPHHVRKGTYTGMKMTPDDSVCIPLCTAAHDEVHRGHDTFEAKYGISLSAAAAEAWQKSPPAQRYRLAQQTSNQTGTGHR